MKARDHEKMVKEYQLTISRLNNEKFASEKSKKNLYFALSEKTESAIQKARELHSKASLSEEEQTLLFDIEDLLLDIEGIIEKDL